MAMVEGLVSLSTADWLGVAATVVAIFGVALSVVLYRRSKDTKLLQYALLGDQSLETNTPFPGLAIHVTYPSILGKGTSLGDVGERLQSPRIWTFRVKNAGKLKVRRAEDFERPLAVKSTDGALVNVFVRSTSRDGVHALGPVRDGYGTAEEIDITPSLMNSNDWMEILVLTDGATAEPIIESWIVDETRPTSRVSPIVLARDETRKYQAKVAAYAIPAGFGIVVTVVLANIFRDGYPDWLVWVFRITLLSTLYCVILAYLRAGRISLRKELMELFLVIGRRNGW